MLADFRELINKPNGIVLVTGPTGSGKTTTLYSALNELNDIDRQDHHHRRPGRVRHRRHHPVPINPEIDVTFAAALRAILRQDPDMILVGEIRDLETAQIAVQASLTGHMVFSTLHTNDAPSSITRLRDMGLEPFLITATRRRRSWPSGWCARSARTAGPSSSPTREHADGAEPDARGRRRARSSTTARAATSATTLGYKGRMGIYELLIMNDDLRDMISRGASHRRDPAAHCRKTGMPTLRDAGPAGDLHAGRPRSTKWSARRCWKTMTSEIVT